MVLERGRPGPALPVEGRHGGRDRAEGLVDAKTDLGPLVLDLVHGGLQRDDHRCGTISPCRHRFDVPPDPLSLSVDDGAPRRRGPGWTATRSRPPVRRPRSWRPVRSRSRAGGGLLRVARFGRGAPRRRPGSDGSHSLRRALRARSGAPARRPPPPCTRPIPRAPVAATVGLPWPRPSPAPSVRPAAAIVPRDSRAFRLGRTQLLPRAPPAGPASRRARRRGVRPAAPPRSRSEARSSEASRSASADSTLAEL